MPRARAQRGSDVLLFTLPCNGVRSGQHQAAIDGTCDWCGEQVDLPLEEVANRRTVLTLHCGECGRKMRCEACG